LVRGCEKCGDLLLTEYFDARSQRSKGRIMDGPQHFSGIGTVYRSDGSALPEERRYSFILVPWYEPTLPLAIGSSVELRNQEPLQLESERLTIQLSDGRWFTFHVVDVSETAPHHHTIIADDWPSERAGRPACERSMPDHHFDQQNRP
jgi:hypothetical protein